MQRTLDASQRRHGRIRPITIINFQIRNEIMGVYNYLLSGKKRKVAIEGVVNARKSTLRLMPFGYKFHNFMSDQEERRIARLDRAAEKRADKINETPEQLEFMAKRNYNIQSGKPSLAGISQPPNLIVHADSWDDVEEGDRVYIFEGNGNWIDTCNYAEAFGFIVGKKANGQFIVGESYEGKIETNNYLDGSKRKSYLYHRLVKEKDYLREENIRRPHLMYHTEERVELVFTPAPEPEPVVVPERDELAEAMWAFS